MNKLFNKIKHIKNKKEIAIIIVIVISLSVLSIYSTFATDVSVNNTTNANTDLSYQFDISDNINKQVTVNANSTKTIELAIKNTNNATIKYAAAYTMVSPSTLPSGSIISQLSSSIDPVQGTINYNQTKNISINIKNETASVMTLNLSIVTGYENGGELSSRLVTGQFLIPYPLDTSGANIPLIENTGLIPVYYQETCSDSAKTYTEGGCWVVADINNGTSTHQWYDYDEQKWANAVLATSTNRSSYLASNAKGTVINQADILAYYVWIPRFKYKVWNINKVAGTNSHLYPDGTTSARDNGIEIKFESGTNTTGSITCNYDFTKTATDSVRVEDCTGANGDYYTHPAFFVDTNQNSVHDTGEKELTGFWMGKYEIASENGTAATSDSTYGGGESTSLTPRILPNITSWRNNYIPNMHTVTRNMQVSSNIYGLPTSTTTIESHLLTNQEWGAVAYLTNSKYGRCPNGSCSEVQKNSFGGGSYDTTRTGCGPQTDGGTTFSTTCNQYTTTLGKLASTTNNVYGIYDMSGGAWEYVMGNMSSSSNLNSFVLNLSSSYGTFNPTPTYINGYDYGTTDIDQIAYNRGRLGDATSEVVTTVSASIGVWYDDYTNFPSGNYPWLLRGRYFYFDTSAGTFAFDNAGGSRSADYAFRVALS